MDVEAFSEIATIHDQALLSLICGGLEEAGVPFLVEPAQPRRNGDVDKFKLFSPTEYKHQITRIVEQSRREFESQWDPNDSAYPEHTIEFT